jgi:hypothetical protein
MEGEGLGFVGVVDSSGELTGGGLGLDGGVNGSGKYASGSEGDPEHGSWENT